MLYGGGNGSPIPHTGAKTPRNVHERKDGLMRRVQAGVRAIAHDVSGAAKALRQDRATQIVILLLLLPWIAALVIHRNLNVWIPLAEIGGIVIIYWFFTRHQPYANLPVRRPLFETLASIAFVVIWIAYRIGEYLRLIVMPPLSTSCCGDLSDTILPKTIEMFLIPLFLFLLLRYSLGKLGLGLPLRAWLPSLLPLLDLVVEGLSHQEPLGLLTRTFSFYIAAGLPEEFLFRGLVQSRLESLTGRPVVGLFLGALVFGLSHLPIDLYGAGWAHWEVALENAFTFQMGVGFALGFAFQRTRNLWPLTLIHALVDAAPIVLT
jgi:membrane protease YdiL (CAAX protease family)